MSPRLQDLGENRFDLTIVDSGDPSRAVAIARTGYDLAIEPLSCSDIRLLTDFRTRLVAVSSGGGRPTVQQLHEFGQSLFNFIVQLAIHRVYNRLPESHISLQIFSNRPDLQALPWEYIQQPGKKPGPNALRSVVRIVPTIGIECPRPLKLGKTVRMLFVHAEPKGESAVAWEDIKESIEREFLVQLSDLPRAFKLDVVEGATVSRSVKR